MHEPPIPTPYLFNFLGGSTWEGVFIAIFIIGLANSQMKTGRKTLDFLSKPLLVFAKHRRKLANAQTVRRMLSSNFAKFAENMEPAPTIFLSEIHTKTLIVLYLYPLVCPSKSHGKRFAFNFL